MKNNPFPLQSCLSLFGCFALFCFISFTTGSIGLALLIGAIFFSIGIFLDSTTIVAYLMSVEVERSEKAEARKGLGRECHECENMAYPIEGNRYSYLCEYCGHEFEIGQAKK